jgi:hypothetical protein
VNRKVIVVSGHELHLKDKIITVGSDKWFDWLENNDVFHYIPTQLSGYFYTRQEITAKKRKNGYWYGLRTFNNKQTVKYIGKTECLDYDKLQLTVDSLSVGF